MSDETPQEDSVAGAAPAAGDGGPIPSEQPDDQASQDSTAVHRTALLAYEHGLCPIPPKLDGSKCPVTAWKKFQHFRPSLSQINKWWASGHPGLGYVLGKVSGSVEALDFDCAKTHERFVAKAEVVGLGDVLKKLSDGYHSRSPSGGSHYLYRCDEIEGNQKLACIKQTPDEKKRKIRKTLIETKGEGGFVIDAPSYGAVHPSGKPYEMVSGTLATIPTLTPDERESLLALARTFDETEKPAAKPATKSLSPKKGDRVGDDFSARASWHDILPPHGWTFVFERNGESYWRRPDKTWGWSATTGRNEADNLYVFTTSTEFTSEEHYSKFAVYAIYIHGGDFKAAAKDLAKQGYGKRRTGGSPSDAPAESCLDLPRVVIGVDEKRVNDEVYRYLAKRDGLYAYGGALCEIGFDEQLGISKIRLITRARLRELLADTVSFIRIGQDEDGDVVERLSHPPEWCVEALLVRGDYPSVRLLFGCVDFPVMNAKGTILCKEGYDPETHLYASAGAAVAIATPTQPTQEDAKQAVEVLFDLIRDFPIFDPKMHSAYIASILSVVARPAVPGPCPAVLIDSPTPGTGKGLLVSLLASVATGQPIPIEVLNPDPMQQKTQFTSVVRDGQRLVNIDNLPPTMRSSVLEAFITATYWRDRQYHTQSNGAWPNFTVLILNGNNFEPTEDLRRRCLYVRLQTTCERPEDRTDFKYDDLLGHVAANRATILGAVFTILKAYVAAGKPKMPTAAWGSFEGWRNLVANACVFAGLPDPTATKSALQSKAGNALDAVYVVLKAFRAMVPLTGMTGKEFLKAVEPTDANGDRMPDGDFDGLTSADVMAALEALTNGEPSSRSVGYLFRKYEGRIIRNLRLVRSDRSEGGCRFIIEEVADADPVDAVHAVDAPPLAGIDAVSSLHSSISPSFENQRPKTGPIPAKATPSTASAASTGEPVPTSSPPAAGADESLGRLQPRLVAATPPQRLIPQGVPANGVDVLHHSSLPREPEGIEKDGQARTSCIPKRGSTEPLTASALETPAAPSLVGYLESEPL